MSQRNGDTARHDSIRRRRLARRNKNRAVAKQLKATAGKSATKA
jgi:hypothetical protein